MSRVGKMPVEIPSGVTVTIDDSKVSASGPKGQLEVMLLPGIKVEQKDGQLIVSRNVDTAENRARQGLVRALSANIVEGVSKGFERKLEINGVGYRVQAQGQELKFNLGYSHEVVYKLQAGVAAAIEQNVITITGADKQLVGQTAAEIRALRKPEPYKGKGIKYSDEHIIRKSGKSGKEAGGA